MSTRKIQFAPRNLRIVTYERRRAMIPGAHAIEMLMPSPAPRDSVVTK